MSLFCRQGMTEEEAAGIEKALAAIIDAVDQRLRAQEMAIADLRAEIDRLKAGPRKSLNAKLRERRGS